MKRKNIFICILMLLTSFSVVFAETDGNAIIDASLISQSPDPAYAGDTVEVRFSVENIGWATSDYLTAYVEEDYPFSVQGDNSVNIGTLLNGQNNDYKQVIKFNVKIDPDTQAGDHTLTLVVADSNGNEKNFDFTISVESKDSIEILSINKAVIGPGNEEELVFNIKNVGTANLRDLKFSISSQDNVILPVLADNSYYISSLNVGEEKNISFDVIASSTVEADVYPIDIEMSYQDSLTGDSSVFTTEAGIYIGGTTQFDLVYDEDDSGEYAFTIANVGSNDADSVKITVKESDSWKSSDGKTSDIIGNLNTGDYTSTSFELTNTNSQDTTLDFEIEYTDTMGIRQIVEKEVSISSGTTASGNMTGTGMQGNFATGNTQNRGGPMSGFSSVLSGMKSLLINGVIVLVVLVVGIFGFRSYRKKQILAKKKANSKFN